MDSQVHFSEARRDTVFLMTIEGQLVRILLVHLHEMRALHKHSAGAAGGIEYFPVIGFKYVDNELHKGDWRKKLAVIVSALIRKLGQEIFVYAPKDVARGFLQLLRIQLTQ